MTEGAAAEPDELEVKGRTLAVSRVSRGVAWFSFAELCEQPLGAGDYIGAEIVKIERPGVGDVSRQIGPHFLNGESAYFLNVNRNKSFSRYDDQRSSGRQGDLLMV